MPFVSLKYNVDSVRFANSNKYYISKIDEYIKIFENAKKSLDRKKESYEKLKQLKDSLKRDSIKKLKEVKTIKLDSIKVMPNF